VDRGCRGRRAALSDGEQEGGVRRRALVDDDGHRRAGQRRAIDHRVKLRRVATTGRLPGIAVFIGQRRSSPHPVGVQTEVGEHVLNCRVLQKQ